jgi:hypothetical protein
MKKPEQQHPESATDILTAIQQARQSFPHVPILTPHEWQGNDGDSKPFVLVHYEWHVNFNIVVTVDASFQTVSDMLKESGYDNRGFAKLINNENTSFMGGADSEDDGIAQGEPPVYVINIDRSHQGFGLDYRGDSLNSIAHEVYHLVAQKLRHWCDIYTDDEAQTLLFTSIFALVREAYDILTNDQNTDE